VGVKQQQQQAAIPWGIKQFMFEQVRGSPARHRCVEVLVGVTQQQQQQQQQQQASIPLGIKQFMIEQVRGPGSGE
jgi:hypothetical protein